MSAAGVLINELRERGMSVATAESCTGGLISAALTAIPGASEVFGYGLITYSNEAKQALLQVPTAILAEHGAVSEATARAMASGLLKLSGADIAIAVTGVAGPGGGSAEKPVGLVYIAVGNGGGISVERHIFSGGRDEIRRQTAERGIEMALDMARKGYKQ